MINPVESFIEMKKANAEIFPMVVEVFNVSKLCIMSSRLAVCSRVAF
jgi:hypothetical protein